MVQGFTYWDNPKYPELTVKDAENKQHFDYLWDKAENEILRYCIEHKIYIRDAEHQNPDFHGVPVVDGYAFAYSLRTWSSLMSYIWTKITGKNYSYLDFYCETIYRDSIDGTPYNKPSPILD